MCPWRPNCDSTGERTGIEGEMRLSSTWTGFVPHRPPVFDAQTLAGLIDPENFDDIFDAFIFGITGYGFGFFFFSRRAGEPFCLGNSAASFWTGCLSRRFE